MARKKIFMDELKPIRLSFEVFGEDGRRFIEQASQKAKPEPPEVLARIKANYEMIKANTEQFLKEHPDFLTSRVK